MKITIDTKEDSHEEISKVIFMLQNLIGKPPESGAILNESSEPTEEATNSFMNMFGQPEPNSEDQEEETLEEEKNEEPSVLLY